MANDRQLSALADPPAYFRAAKAKGSAPRVDREGGAYGAGVIRGVSVITAGEAVGHGVWIDQAFIDQAAAALAEEPNGIKSRWTHPDMSGDGLGKMTSRVMGPETSADGRQLLATQHFLKIGHSSPDGDLAAYLMDLAEEDPSAYGLSIVFYPDEAAAEEFRLANLDADGLFRSPDPLNVDHLPHVRLGWLVAADAVDTPAANPAGLFSKRDGLVAEADAIFEYALGLRDEKPAPSSFGVDADRLRGFAARFLHSHHLTLHGAAMDPITDPAAVAPPTAPAAVTPPPAPEEPTLEQVAASSRAEAKRFRDAFGDDGAIWYADGLTFEAAQAKQNEKLSARVAALEAKAAAAGQVTGETSAAGFTASDGKTHRGLAGKLRFPGEAKSA